MFLSKTRSFIRESPNFYPFYIRMKTGKILDWPDENTDGHVTGFARSANTFCRHLVTYAFPRLKFVTHIHTAASIKTALRYKIPTQVIVRHPKSSIVSNCLKMGIFKTDSNRIGQLFEDHLRYHRFVLENGSHLDVLDFSLVTSDPLRFLMFMSERLHVHVKKHELKIRLADIQKMVVEKEKSKKMTGSSLPNEQRDRLKKEYSHVIETHPVYDESIRIYEALIAKRKL